MCLIIYSPDAKPPRREHFSEAAVNNPDGIGVMSADGVAKFLGKRKTRRAWRYVQQIAADGIPYAVHFRWATHGRVSRANCHPFEIPGTGAHLMHNGVLWTSHFANDDESDTVIFAKDVMPKYYEMAQQGARDYLTALGSEAVGNRLLLMYPGGRRFDVINRHLWTLYDGILYSNTYSINDIDGGWNNYLSRSRQVSTSGMLSGALTRQWSRTSAAPSGPTLGEADEDETDPAEEAWIQDYEDALDSGFNEDDAEAWANDQAWRREMTAPSLSPYEEAKRNGFDWQDARTWDRYPSQRVLNRHGANEDDGDLDTPSPADMFI